MSIDIHTETIETDVRTARRDELDVASRILTAAFQDDPIFAWCIPDAERRRRILPDFFALVGRTIGVYDRIHLAPSGAAMWVPPGSPVVPDGAAEDLETDLATLLGEDAGRTFELIAVMDENHPRTDHHYLWFLGVEPERQGKGIGSQLLRHGLGAADLEGQPAYLEATSEHNVRLYQRHGFQVVTELRAAGSPPLTAMWRPATARRHVGTEPAVGDCELSERTSARSAHSSTPRLR